MSALAAALESPVYILNCNILYVSSIVQPLSTEGGTKSRGEGVWLRCGRGLWLVWVWSLSRQPSYPSPLQRVCPGQLEAGCKGHPRGNGCGRAWH